MRRFLEVASLFTMVCGASMAMAESPASELLPRVCERPLAVSVSPEGTALAIIDQFTNRIVVADFFGRILWTASCNDASVHPSAVCMISDEELWFVSRENRLLYKVTKQSSTSCDTLSSRPLIERDKAIVTQLFKMPNGTFIVFDSEDHSLKTYDVLRDSLFAFKAKVSGRLLAVSLSPSKRLVVTTQSHKPVQVLTPEGDFIVAPGWTAAPSEQSWDAGVVCVDIRERIWAMDITNRKARIFDMAGTEIDSRAFPDGLSSPVAVASAADGATVIIFEDGTMYRYDD